MNNVIKKILAAMLIAIMLIMPSMAIVKAQGPSNEQSYGPVIVVFPPGTSTTTAAYSYPESTPTSYYYVSSSGPIGGPISDPPSAQSDEFTGVVTLPLLPNHPTTESYYFVQLYGSFTGFATVYVPYDPSDYPTGCYPRLCMGDPVAFTNDAVVNLADVALMIQAIKEYQSGTLSPAGIMEFDLNHDGVVNYADLLIVLQYLFFGLPAQGGRLPWVDITVGYYYDPTTQTNYVVGITNHFSIFGVRP